MKKRLALILALCLCGTLFAGCGSSAAPNAPEGSQDVVEYTDEVMDGCFVSFEDGDYYEDVPIENYGDEIELPETKNDSADGEFCGWVNASGFYQPGDKAVTEEFMTFTAVRTSPDMGTLLILDSVRGGYSMMSSSEPMELYSPYESSVDSSHDDFFDHWEDEEGIVYEIGGTVPVENGQLKILNSVYSTDYSQAYKVEVYYNIENEDLNFDYYNYVKKGSAIPMWLMFEPEGVTFEGWYDAPEGGNRICGEEDLYTPESDIALYGHWAK